MNPITAILLVAVGMCPICYIALKLIFRNTVMFQVSLWTVFYTIFSSLVYFIAGVQGVNSLLWVLPLAFIVGLIVYIFINKLLTKPLENTINSVKYLCEGDLSMELEKVDKKNEIGILNNSILQLVENLSSIVNEIKNSAENLSDSSISFTNASEQISQGASEQAASVEEISATMEEMASNIETNTENALEAEKLSKVVINGIKDVNQAGVQSLNSVYEIARKISFINELAMQTNILSLNASVEAARAGVYGKGFAVVAAEVKRLAEKSRIEADEIGKLAEKSVRITESAGKLMAELIPYIEKTTQLIQEITAASIEQNKGSFQINSSIQQLNGIAQQNAAASEEMASNAVELSSKAMDLKKLILYFKFHR